MPYKWFKSQKEQRFMHLCLSLEAYHLEKTLALAPAKKKEKKNQLADESHVHAEYSLIKEEKA